MQKLFLVQHNDPYAAGDESECHASHWETIGIFSSKEKAEACVADYKKKHGAYCSMNIAEIELDKAYDYGVM
jgi:hypothetical protein